MLCFICEIGIKVWGPENHFLTSPFRQKETLCFFVSSQTLVAVSGDPDPVDIISLTKGWLSRVCELLKAQTGKIHEGELAAFLSYAIAYPQNFLPVIDSYSVKW